jgi:hypothetical protein
MFVILGDTMWEAAVIYMRSAPGWVEMPTTNANHVFQFQEVVMTIFPNGNWRCVAPNRLVEEVRTGTVHNLEKFLTDFGEANHV